MLVDQPLRDLLDAFASSSPTPGGGSAAALASATGASLLMMVAGLPKTRHNSEDDRQALAAAASALAGIRARLRDAIDTDTAAYDAVVAAYRLPKASPEDQAARQTAVQAALRIATEVPLGVLRASVEALEHGLIVAAHGHKAASSDVGVALALLRAGADGAALNVNTNLGSLTDEAFRATTSEVLARLSAEAARISAAGR